MGLPIFRFQNPKVTSDDQFPYSNVPLDQIESIFAVAFSISGEKIEKLSSLGKFRTLITYRKDFVLIQTAMFPLVLSIITDLQVDADHALQCANTFTQVLAPLQDTASSGPQSIAHLNDHGMIESDYDY